MEKKAQYWVWYHAGNGNLDREVITAWNADDARDIFFMNGGNQDMIEKIELATDAIPE